jgi:hypothetical protein
MVSIMSASFAACVSKASQFVTKFRAFEVVGYRRPIVFDAWRNAADQFQERNMLKTASIAMGTLLALSTAGAAWAETAWEATHPRRDQVNDRLEHQNRRIHQEVREGELSHAQAAKLHRQDHRVRQEERAMASRHGGHITKPEQAALNRQENRISREIGE